jgi:hypothetical protein
MDRAPYDQPRLPAASIEHVYVNGKLSFSKSDIVVEREGRLIGGRN